MMISPTKLFARIILVCGALLVVGCGLADDEQDEKDKYTYIHFTDAQFKQFCLSQLDLNGDSRISRYESRRVWKLDCSGQGIRSLADIEEFPHLRTLICRDNLLMMLDVKGCPNLRELDCSDNQIQHLNLDRLRALWRLDCSKNLIDQLDVHTNVSLEKIAARENQLMTLDLKSCNLLREVDTRQNPHLETLYVKASQNINYRIDGHTQVVVE